MNDSRKTKAQLIEELDALRERVRQFEGVAASPGPAPQLPAVPAPPLAPAGDVAFNRETLNRIVSLNPFAIQVFDRDGHHVYGNSAFVEIFGSIPPKEYSLWSDPILEKAGVLPDVLTVKEGRVVRVGEVWYNAHDLFPDLPDRLRCVRGVVFPVMNSRGDLEHVVCVHEDVTDRQRTEDALRAGEAKYRDLVENANSIIMRRTTDGRIMFFNEYAQRFFGYREEEIRGRHVVGTIVPDTDTNGRDLRAMIDDIGRHPEKYAANENENIRQNGERVWIAWTNKAIRDEEGNVVEILCVGNDVTERKRADQLARIERDLAVGLNATENSQGALRMCLNAAIRAGGMDCGGVYLFDETTGRLELPVHTGLSAELVQEVRQYEPGAEAVRVVEAAEAIYTRTEEIDGPLGDACRREGLRAVAGIPFQHKGRVIGLLSVGSHTIEETPLFARDALETIAAHAGSAVARAKAEEALRESEERYRELFENANDIVYTHDLQGRFTSMNKAAERISGYTPADARALTISDAVAPEFREMVARMVERKMLADPRTRYDVDLLTKDGKRVPIEVNSRLIFRDGNPVGVQGIARDMTAHRAAEAALRESEEKYRTILESIEEGYYELDQDGDITFCNDALCRIMGRSRDELLTMNYRQYYADETSALNAYETFKEVYATGISKRESNWEITTKDGVRRSLELSISLVLGPSNEPAGFRGIARDVTERRRAEEAIRRAKEEWERTFDTVPDAISIIDADFRIQRVNKAMADRAGLRPQDLVGCICFECECLHQGRRPAESCPHMKTMADGREHIAEIRDERRGADFLVSTSPIRDSDHPGDGTPGRILATVHVARDITALKQAERALQVSEEKYRTILESIEEGYYEVDLDERFVFVNDAMCRIVGRPREELVGKHYTECYTPGTEPSKIYRIFRQVFVTGRPTRGMDWEIIKQDGTKSALEISVSLVRDSRRRPAGFRGMVRDITERKKGEEERRHLAAQIEHTQKLESLGILAGGIAHDFNNLLVGIMGNAGLALMRLTPDSTARHNVEQIEKTAKRAADLTNQMLAYSGKGTYVVRPLDLSRTAEEIGHLLEASVSKNAVLRYNFARNLPPVLGDPTQIQQVIMNLITNASDAIGDKSGLIAITTGMIRVDRAYLSETYLNDDLEGGGYVYLEVTDTGCGMDRTTQVRMFDPFFTTKFTGRGLGLAATLGIVRGHKGAIKVYSEPGRGTTVRVLFPRAAVAEPPSQERLAAPQTDTLRDWRGSGAILLVDDEDYVRAVAKEALEEQGFRVLTACDGFEAVEMYRAHSDEIVAVLLDLTMPRLSGEDAFEEIRRIRHNVRVILSSGYSEEEATHRFAGKSLAGFIQKPYLPNDLLAKLRDILESPPEP